MASPDIHNGVLVANTITTMTVDLFNNQISVISRGHSGEEIWVTIDGSSPTVNGDEVYMTTGVVVIPTRYSTTTVVKLLSTSAVAFQVKGEYVPDQIVDIG
jgi:hypothetical protein